MTDLLSIAAAEFSDLSFIEDANRSLTFSETEELVAKRATELGDRMGEQVAVRPSLDIESVVELLGTVRSSACPVVLSPQLPEARANQLIGLAAADHRPCHSILFTSGSTGAPRGVRFSSSNWEACGKASIAGFRNGPSDRWLCPLPLHHVGGLSVIFRCLVAGGQAVLAPDLDRAVALFDSVHLASVVPTQLRRMLERLAGRFRPTPRVLIGGGPIDESLLDQATGAGLTVLPTYGMTETTALVATARTGDSSRRLYPLPGIEIRIGDGGSIEVKGATISLGYLSDPENLPGEWFRTADVGLIEDDGSLRVLGRADRTIISGGENVDAAELEAMIASGPGVVEVAVVGIPNDEWGQVVVAVYTGNASADDLRHFLEDRVAPAAIPKRWLRVRDLPRTELGKVDRDALVSLFDT